MTVIEEQNCPHDITADISPAMKKYSTIDINEYTKVGDTVGYTEEGNPIVYDPYKVAGHAAAMDYVKDCTKPDDPITQVICTNPPIYKTESGKEYYDTAKTKPYTSSTSKSHYDGELPTHTTDYHTAKREVEEYIQKLNDKKVESMLDNNYKFVGIFNENLADRDILSVNLTLKPDVGTIDFICDMMDARLPFDLHFTQNGVVEIIYDRRD